MTPATQKEAQRLARWRTAYARRPFLKDANIRKPTATQRALADALVKVQAILDGATEPRMVLHAAGQVERLIRELHLTTGRRRHR